MSAEPTRLYPVLSDLGPGLREQIAALPVLDAPQGAVLFREDQACAGFPLVLEGEVRVSRASADGRNLELYRVAPGEICLVSSACLFRGAALSARGTTLRPTRLVLIPPALFEAAMGQAGFRGFVLGLFAERMADLTSLVDAVAFTRLDQRLAAALLGHGPELAITHQGLADELGTVREMVTRLLRRFEREGWVELSRERIRIRDAAALRAQAHGGPV